MILHSNWFSKLAGVVECGLQSKCFPISIHQNLLNALNSLLYCGMASTSALTSVLFLANKIPTIDCASMVFVSVFKIMFGIIISNTPPS